MVLFATILAASVVAGALVETTKLVASDGAVRDWFGFAVGISGNIAVVGAYLDDDGGELSGSAYVFRRNESAWEETQKLTASDAATYDFFGDAVSISGDIIVVGAYGDDDVADTSGAAYVFRTTDDGFAWEQTQKLKASDAQEADRFGRAVAISGTLMIVGAFGDDDVSDSSGAAYMFRSEDGGISWVQTQKLTANDSLGGWFGYAVAISGNLAVVGAYGDDVVGPLSGSAYTFRSDDDGLVWVQTQKLTSSDLSSGDNFGLSVGISGNLAVVGSIYDDDGGFLAGAAYVFRTVDGTSWVQTFKLKATDAFAGDYFGGAVSIAGDLAVVGARWDDDAGTFSGSAYVFATDDDGLTWYQTHKLAASDGAVEDYFGHAVAISDATALVGAYYHDDEIAGEDAGSVYVYSVETLPPTTAPVAQPTLLV